MFGTGKKDPEVVGVIKKVRLHRKPQLFMRDCSSEHIQSGLIPLFHGIVLFSSELHHVFLGFEFHNNKRKLARSNHELWMQVLLKQPVLLFFLSIFL